MDVHSIRQVLAAAAALQQDATSIGVGRSLGSAKAESPTQFDVVVRNVHIRAATRSLFANGHYARAVEEAFKCLNNHVKTRSGLSNADGDALMRTAFSANNPVLRLNKGQNQSQRDEQQGYMDIFAGSMKGIRNPRAHDHKLEDDPVMALELLTLASHLMDKAEQSTRSRRSRTKTP